MSQKNFFQFQRKIGQQEGPRGQGSTGQCRSEGAAVLGAKPPRTGLNPRFVILFQRHAAQKVNDS